MGTARRVADASAGLPSSAACHQGALISAFGKTARLWL